MNIVNPRDPRTWPKPSRDDLMGKKVHGNLIRDRHQTDCACSCCDANRRRLRGFEWYLMVKMTWEGN